MNKIFTYLILLFVGIFYSLPIFGQTASILPNAVTQFFDNNGNSLSGGSVTTYIPGTTSNKTTWQDSTELIPNSNPIILDAGGKAIIWGQGTYREIVKDALGNIIWDAVTNPGSSGGSGTNIGDGLLVGSILPWSGVTAPNQYLFAAGQAISRTTFSTLLSAISQTSNVVCTSASNTLTGMSDTTQIPVGAPVELTCLTPGTIVVSKTSSSVTVSNPSNVSINAAAIFFPYGNGDGSTTFNIPDLRGYVIAGNNNMTGAISARLTSTFYGANPNATGAAGGTQSDTITVAQINLPNVTLTTAIASGQGSHTHTIPNVIGNATNGNQGSGGGNIAGALTGQVTGTTTLPAMSGTTPLGGSGTGITFATVQPTLTLNYIIKVTPDSPSSIITGVTSIGGMQGVIACGSGILCTGNTITSNFGNIAPSTIAGNNTGSSTVPFGLTGAQAEQLLEFTQNGTNAVQELLDTKIKQYWVTPEDFGAAHNGSTDDTAAIQRAINALIAQGGGTLYFPPSSACYKTIAQLTINLSAIATRFQGALNIQGSSPLGSCITNTTLNTAIIQYTGNASNPESYLRIQRIRLSGNLVSGSEGLNFNIGAYVTFDNVIVEAFDYGLDTTDIDQIGVYNSNFRFNNHGLIGNAASSVTSANSWSFYNTVIANNKVYGAQITNPNAFNFNGGSIQYNGTIGGGATQFGISLIEAGNGYGNVGFSNMAFEGNGGVADVVSNQTTNPVQMTFNNVAWARTAPLTTAITSAANNGSGAIRLAVTASAGLTSGTIFVQGVVGTTEANSATPWAYTIIDGTHVDLTGSSFSNAYISGGTVSTVGFATNNIQATGANANAIYRISNSAFRNFAPYAVLAGRPTIALTNTSSLILDDGSNYFQSATEKLTYPQLQRILDDGSAWTAFTPVITSGTGTFTTTSAAGRWKKNGKTVSLEGTITATTIGSAATSMIASLPFTAQSACSWSGMNLANGKTMTGQTAASGTNATFFLYDGTFPVAAGGNTFVFSGVCETQ